MMQMKSASQLSFATETGRFPKILWNFGREPERERFPRRPGKLGLWGKAKSAVHAAGFDEDQRGLRPSLITHREARPNMVKEFTRAISHSSGAGEAGALVTEV
jgi:hypothetical protein